MTNSQPGTRADACAAFERIAKKSAEADLLATGEQASTRTMLFAVQNCVTDLAIQLAAMHGAYRTAAAPAEPAAVPGNPGGKWLDHLCRAVRKARGIRLDLENFDGDKRGISAALGEAEDGVLAIAMRAPEEGMPPTDPGHVDAVRALREVMAELRTEYSLQKQHSPAGAPLVDICIGIVERHIKARLEAEGRQP